MEPDLQDVLGPLWRLYHRRIVAVGVLLLLAIAGSSVFYKVEADSEAVVLRLGKYLRTTQPGLHFKLPWPVDSVHTVPVRKIQSIEFGYTTLRPGRRTRFSQQASEHTTMARMLTADLNLAHVEWVVQYRIHSAFDYLFKIGGPRRARAAANAGDLIRDVAEAVMRRNVGDVSVDSVITTGREQIAADAEVEMQKMLDSYDCGIDIVTVKLQSATPPDPVKDAFDAVNRAKQNKERIVNEAKGERNRYVPAARGQRDRTILEAEGYAIRVEKEARGRASAFLSKLTEYEKAPKITRTRIYLEAMEEILQQVDKKIIIDESVRGLVPLLPIGGESLDLPAGTAPIRRSRGGSK